MKHIKNIDDRTIWDSYIGRYAPVSFFQSWDWGNIAGNIGRYGMYDGDTLVGVAQVEHINALRGAFLRVRHGPILSSWSSESLDIWCTFLTSLGKTYGVRFLRISPLIANTPEHQALFFHKGWRDAPIHAMDGEYCLVLDIQKSEPELLAGMRKTTRYLIKQAQTIGVTIRHGTDDDLDIFFSLYRHTSERQKFVAHTGIQEEYRTLRERDAIVLLIGEYQGTAYAAAMIVFYHHQAIYHHSGSREQKIPVNYLLQWEAIKEAKKRGKTMYNFWGIAPDHAPRHPWIGLSTFKKGFGGQVVEYLHAKDYPLSSSYWITYGIEYARKVWKGY